MFRHSSLACALFAGLFAAAPASAADSNGNFAVHGAGSQSCAQYITAVDGQADNQEVLIYVSWAQGYLSSLNRLQQNAFDVLPISGANDIAVLLARICRQNQEVPYANAVLRLARAFAPMQIATDSPTIELTRGDTTVRVRKAALAMVQQYLKDSGRYGGNVDGVFGERTAEAITEFQGEAEVPQTGLPDLNTFAAILARIVQAQQQQGNN